MTAVMREALERLNASSITSSSIRFSLTGGPVGWMTKTSAPRTLSWIWNHTSPSLKRARWARPRGIPRQRQMDSPRAGWALPVNTLSSLAIVRSLEVNPRSLVKLGGAPQPPDPRSLEVNPRSLVKLGGAPQPPDPRSLEVNPRLLVKLGGAP